MKFEKACFRKDLRAFMLLYRFMKSGQILPIPNFIVFSISLKCLDFQGLPESGAFGLRHFYAVSAWTFLSEALLDSHNYTR